jgi:hypothetical protein
MPQQVLPFARCGFANVNFSSPLTAPAHALRYGERSPLRSFRNCTPVVLHHAGNSSL